MTRDVVSRGTGTTGWYVLIVTNPHNVNISLVVTTWPDLCSSPGTAVRCPLRRTPRKSLLQSQSSRRLNYLFPGRSRLTIQWWGDNYRISKLSKYPISNASLLHLLFQVVWTWSYLYMKLLFYYWHLNWQLISDWLLGKSIHLL